MGHVDVAGVRYELPDGRVLLDDVTFRVRQGSIVLSHDNKQPDTITAYQTLIPWLQQYFTLERLTT